MTFWQDELSVEDIENLTIGDLVTLGECSYPDNETSPGAEFLGYVKRDVLEALADESWALHFDESDATEKATEIANEAPSHHNHTRWMEAGDLAAYQEEPELGAWPEGDLLEAAGVALYQVANRIAYGIFERYIAWRNNQVEDETIVDDEESDDDDGRPVGSADLTPTPLPDSEDDDLFPANAGSSE